MQFDYELFLGLVFILHFRLRGSSMHRFACIWSKVHHIGWLSKEEASERKNLQAILDRKVKKNPSFNARFNLTTHTG